MDINNQKVQRPYGGGYAQVPKKEMDDPRPFDRNSVFAKYIEEATMIGNIGMGTGYKTLPWAKKCKHLYGIEPSVPLIQTAAQNTRYLGLDNVTLVKGIAKDLPFADESLDMVISLLAPHDTKEFYRVLKPGGLFYMEKISDADKREVKLMFGSDDKGPRGYLCELAEGE